MIIVNYRITCLAYRRFSVKMMYMEKYTKNYILIAVWALMIPVFIASQVSFWQGASLKAEAADAASAAIDQNAVEETQDNISDLQKKLEKEEKAKKALQQNLGQIQGAVASTVKEISKTQSAISETEKTISRKEAEISNMNNKIELQKSMLKSLLQETYYNQSQPILNVVLTSANFANVFSDTDHLLTVEDKIRDVSAEIAEAKMKVQQDKSQLAEVKEKHEEILDEKVDQKQELVADQIDVQKDIQKKDATIGELNQKLAELKNDLSSLLGKNLSTDDIVEAAGIASKATGVRKDFILGELVVETNLGTFTGGCTYKNIRMKAADKAEFLKIAEELEKAYGGNYKNKKLSCSPGYGYGGAMGVAQFMPTTWIGYKSYIASATGHNPPDPWSVIDGVMAMAKKLANGGATSKGGEKLASKRYYCGGPSSPYWKNKCETYANNVQYWADNYEKKL